VQTYSLPSVEDVLASPCTRRWLHNALTSALNHDPVDVANDAEFLSALLSGAVPAMTGQLDMRDPRVIAWYEAVEKHSEECAGGTCGGCARLLRRNAQLRAIPGLVPHERLCPASRASSASHVALRASRRLPRLPSWPRRERTGMSMRIRDDAISRLSRRPGFRDAYYENRALVV